MYVATHTMKIPLSYQYNILIRYYDNNGTMILNANRGVYYTARVTISGLMTLIFNFHEVKLLEDIVLEEVAAK